MKEMFLLVAMVENVTFYESLEVNKIPQTPVIDIGVCGIFKDANMLRHMWPVL